MTHKKENVLHKQENAANRIVKKLKQSSEFSKLDGIQVGTEISLSRITLIFSGNLNKETRPILRRFLVNGFGGDIKPSCQALGWSELRIRANSKAERDKCWRWFIEPLRGTHLSRN